MNREKLVNKIISEIKFNVDKIFLKHFSNSSEKKSYEIYKKKDSSIVTELDLSISLMVKKVFLQRHFYSKHFFYSEEDHNHLQFPSIILDPIDGTKELVQGTFECSVSLAVLHSSRIDDGRNWSWIYNPFTGHEVSSIDSFIDYKIEKISKPLWGLISNTEYNQGLYQNHSENDIILVPRGSIANKLALLCSGASDFVISKRHKNIWDIAGGTLRAAQRNFFLFEQGIKLEVLDKEQYSPPLLWCRERDFEFLHQRL